MTLYEKMGVTFEHTTNQVQDRPHISALSSASTNVLNAEPTKRY